MLHLMSTGLLLGSNATFISRITSPILAGRISFTPPSTLVLWLNSAEFWTAKACFVDTSLPLSSRTLGKTTTAWGTKAQWGWSITTLSGQVFLFISTLKNLFLGGTIQT